MEALGDAPALRRGADLRVLLGEAFDQGTGIALGGFKLLLDFTHAGG
jgi:hypothetical protein